MSDCHQIPSAEPTLDPQSGPCRVQTTAASPPTEEDKDGVPSPMATLASIYEEHVHISNCFAS